MSSIYPKIFADLRRLLLRENRVRCFQASVEKASESALNAKFRMLQHSTVLPANEAVLTAEAAAFYANRAPDPSITIPLSIGGHFMQSLRLLAATCILATICSAQSPEEKAAKYMESVRQEPGLLLAFLREMPKGGDLHVHLSGAVYAENMIDWASESALCVDRSTSRLNRAACDSCESYKPNPSIRCAYQDHILYDQIIDAWSMRNWHPADESGHDHFFATFDKFGPAIDKHVGDALAEIASRAAEDHLQYVEVMHTADGGKAVILGTKIGWDDDFDRFRQKLLTGGMSDIVAAVRAQTDADEARQREILQCAVVQLPSPGCTVRIRYLYQVLRGLPREQVFSQIVLGFELAKADPRFVGFNLVMPEDWYVPMHDFQLHMKIIELLHRFYPKTHISLPADELAMGLVPPEGLRFHIRDSIERADAERIGHGTAVMNEDDAIGLLKEMARRKVLVEICLTSNASILGVSGARHPLATYIKYGVPVALATDDEGVSRSDMTHEYLRAVEDQHLTYADLKRMARASLDHSFISGESLWRASGDDDRNLEKNAACGESKLEDPDTKCEKFLEANERARVQRQLESAFVKFEDKF